jgi:hypothetical protein
MNWRKMEADMIREYFFKLWLREYQETQEEEQQRYERARNAADRAADRY